jgi:hypothetical protein
MAGSQFSMSNRILINFTVYGYLKLLTILEAVEQKVPIPPEMDRDVAGLLQLFRNLPPSPEGVN